MTQKTNSFSEKACLSLSPKVRRGTLAVLIAGMCSPLFAVDHPMANSSGSPLVTKELNLNDQNQTVVASGIITDSTGFPLPGVTII